MRFLRTTASMIAASNLAAAGIPIAVIILAHRDGFSGAAIGGLVAVEGVAAFCFPNTDSAVAAYSYALMSPAWRVLPLAWLSTCRRETVTRC
jgi:hypothetical protein